MQHKLVTGLSLVIALVLIFAVACDNLKPVQGGASMAKALTVPTLDTQIPPFTETATFALGWFWGSDSQFGSVDGVVRTRVGYAGGATSNPTYYNIGDYSETVQMVYDPARVSYENLLDVFWNSHDPTFPQSIQQYASIIFYHSEEQKRLAMESKQRVEARLGKQVFTEIIPASKFYLAEDYHQKFYLQQTPELMKDISAVYPKLEDFISSTAVARLNGYAGGFGTEEDAKEQLNSLGLTQAGKTKLLQIAESGLVAACPASGKPTH